MVGLHHFSITSMCKLNSLLTLKSLIVPCFMILSQNSFFNYFRLWYKILINYYIVFDAGMVVLIFC